jgi:hypothetical protein
LSYGSSSRDPQSRRWFTGSVGGPIWKDKTFFFFSYLLQKQEIPRANSANFVMDNAFTGHMGAGKLSKQRDREEPARAIPARQCHGGPIGVQYTSWPDKNRGGYCGLGNHAKRVVRGAKS